jgi:hypothetical protein
VRWTVGLGVACDALYHLAAGDAADDGIDGNGSRAQAGAWAAFEMHGVVCGARARAAGRTSVCCPSPGARSAMTTPDASHTMQYHPAHMPQHARHGRHSRHPPAPRPHAAADDSQSAVAARASLLRVSTDTRRLLGPYRDRRHPPQARNDAPDERVQIDGYPYNTSKPKPTCSANA